MSRQRGLISAVVQNFINSLKPRQASAKLIGSDHLGNSYYEVKPPITANRTRASRRVIEIKVVGRSVQRYYVPKDGDASKFDQPLPAEWEAWLRLRRREPPSEEEIARNLQVIALKKTNAEALENKYKQPEEEKQVITGVKNFPTYKEYEQYPGKGPSS